MSFHQIWKKLSDKNGPLFAYSHKLLESIVLVRSGVLILEAADSAILINATFDLCYALALRHFKSFYLIGFPIPLLGSYWSTCNPSSKSRMCYFLKQFMHFCFPFLTPTSHHHYHQHHPPLYFVS